MARGKTRQWVEKGIKDSIRIVQVLQKEKGISGEHAQELVTKYAYMIAGNPTLYIDEYVGLILLREEDTED